MFVGPDNLLYSVQPGGSDPQIVNLGDVTYVSTLIYNQAGILGFVCSSVGMPLGLCKLTASGSLQKFTDPMLTAVLNAPGNYSNVSLAWSSDGTKLLLKSRGSYS